MLDKLRRWWERKRRRAELTATLASHNKPLIKARANFLVADAEYRRFGRYAWRRMYALKMRVAELETRIAQQVEETLDREFTKN